jgi:2'-5' RNA ligase
MSPLYVVSFPRMSPADMKTVEALRAAHDLEGYSMLPAHITFVFGVVRASAVEMVALLSKVSSRTPAIPFTLNHPMQMVHGDLHYVYLCPCEGRDAMIGLYEALHASLPNVVDSGREFIPHLTVRKTRNKHEAGEVFARIRQSDWRIRGVVQTLGLGMIEAGKFKLLSTSHMAGESELP